jgi:hypothetical protein
VWPEVSQASTAGVAEVRRGAAGPAGPVRPAQSALPCRSGKGPVQLPGPAGATAARRGARGSEARKKRGKRRAAALRPGACAGYKMVEHTATADRVRRTSREWSELGHKGLDDWSLHPAGPAKLAALPVMNTLRKGQSQVVN